jgi:hypothetical protein
MLQETAEMLGPQWDNNEPLVTLEPDADGNYQIAPASVDDPSGPDDNREGDVAGEADNHRQIVFLGGRSSS